MKKYLLWLGIVVLLSGIAGYKPLKNALANTTSDKSIEFVIYKGNNYTSKVYDCTYVQVRVVVEKVRGRKRTIVWDKIYDAKLLKQYPSPQNASDQKIIVPGVLRKEHLEVNYILTYDSKGSELQIQRGTAVVSDDGILNISI